MHFAPLARRFASTSTLTLLLALAGCPSDPISTPDTGTGIDGGGTDGGGTGTDGGGTGTDAPVAAGCGDGVVDRTAGEECDDSNTTPGDGCDASCHIEAPANCGDGMLDLAAGEECDDGNTAPGDGCSASCQIEPVGATCGDGTMDTGEVCDDSNTMGGDGCNPTCNFTGTTTAFAGARYTTTPVRMDGVGSVARFAGSATLAADDTYLWVAEAPPNPTGGLGPVLRRVEVSSGTVLTVGNLSGAEGIATDGRGTVWVAGGMTIEEIDVSGAPPYTSTVVHSGGGCTSAACYMDGLPGTATYGGVRGLTWYGGYLWVVDPSAGVVRRMDPATGELTTVAGTPYVLSTTTPVDGVGAAAQFDSPRYIVSDNSGTLFISDTNGAAIRTLHVPTLLVGTFAGNGTQAYVDGLGGPSGPARVHRPRGITSDGTSIYWVEFNAFTVRQGVVATLDVSTLAGTNGTAGYVEGTGTAAQFDGPFSITYHFPTRALYVFDSANHLIRRIQ